MATSEESGFFKCPSSGKVLARSKDHGSLQQLFDPPFPRDYNATVGNTTREGRCISLRLFFGRSMTGANHHGGGNGEYVNTLSIYKMSKQGHILGSGLRKSGQ